MTEVGCTEYLVEPGQRYADFRKSQLSRVVPIAASKSGGGTSVLYALSVHVTFPPGVATFMPSRIKGILYLVALPTFPCW